jgi:hypothetical protein
MKILPIVAGTALLLGGLWAALALVGVVIRDVAPLSDDEAVRLLAVGKRGQLALPLDAYVPGSLRVGRRPTPHSAEIVADFQTPSGRVRRRLILRFVPEPVSGSEERVSP